MGWLTHAVGITIAWDVTILLGALGIQVGGAEESWLRGSITLSGEGGGEKPTKHPMECAFLVARWWLAGTGGVRSKGAGTAFFAPRTGVVRTLPFRNQDRVQARERAGHLTGLENGLPVSKPSAVAVGTQNRKEAQ